MIGRATSAEGYALATYLVKFVATFETQKFQLEQKFHWKHEICGDKI